MSRALGRGFKALNAGSDAMCKGIMGWMRSNNPLSMYLSTGKGEIRLGKIEMKLEEVHMRCGPCNDHNVIVHRGRE